jgi:5-methylcytosine-specific restriction endonuclease McrA
MKKEYTKSSLNRKYRWIVYFRDSFQCQKCGKQGKIDDYVGFCLICDLVIHHINGDRRNEQLENLITLCSDCHYHIHNGNWRNKPELTLTKSITEEIKELAIQDYNFRFEQVQERERNNYLWGTWREYEDELKK